MRPAKFDWVVEAGIEVVFRSQNALRRTVITHFGTRRFKARIQYKTTGRDVTTTRHYCEARPGRGAADKLTRTLTAFESFREMVEAPANYRPTLLGGGPYALLALWYDHAQKERGDKRRAFTGTRAA